MSGIFNRQSEIVLRGKLHRRNDVLRTAGIDDVLRKQRDIARITAVLDRRRQARIILPVRLMQREGIVVREVGRVLGFVHDLAFCWVVLCFAGATDDCWRKRCE